MTLDTFNTRPASPPPECVDTPTKQWRPSDDDHEPIRHSTISALFSDAAQYGKVIAEYCSERSDSSHTQSSSRPTDFADLVGEDLAPSEKLEAGKFAQVTAEDSDWIVHDEDSAKAGRFTLEPESLADSEESTSSEGHGSISGTTAVHSEESSATTVAAAESSSTALSPEQIVSILIQEFGQLAPDGEEKLLFFKDGAVIQDVVILVSRLFDSVTVCDPQFQCVGHNSRYNT